MSNDNRKLTVTAACNDLKMNLKLFWKATFSFNNEVWSTCHAETHLPLILTNITTY